jgi:hypothetical protein
MAWEWRVQPPAVRLLRLLLRATLATTTRRSPSSTLRRWMLPLLPLRMVRRTQRRPCCPQLRRPHRRYHHLLFPSSLKSFLRAWAAATRSASASWST